LSTPVNAGAVLDGKTCRRRGGNNVADSQVSTVVSMKLEMLIAKILSLSYHSALELCDNLVTINVPADARVRAAHSVGLPDLRTVQVDCPEEIIVFIEPNPRTVQVGNVVKPLGIRICDFDMSKLGSDFIV